VNGKFIFVFQNNTTCIVILQKYVAMIGSKINNNNDEVNNNYNIKQQ
jgi:hypothetical protein